jgi:hypothetical protein
MCRMHAMTLSVAVILLAAGCSKQPSSEGSSTTPNGAAAATNDKGDTVAKDDGPAKAVEQFLEAVKTGNDKAAANMLSAVTRQRTAALNYAVKPPASDTAKFTIGKVDYVNADGARVACTWTDLDPDGQPKTDEAIWVVRREANGWRIAGVAAQVFPGEPPLLLNFEDPEDMVRKQQWVREEIRRRQAKEEAGLQAQGEEKGEKPLRR